MNVTGHRLHDSTIAFWQSLIDQMHEQVASGIRDERKLAMLGTMDERKIAMFKRGAEIARKIDRLDFAACNVNMDSSGFINSTTRLLCEGCGHDQLLVPQDGDLSGEAVCPACGIRHGTFKDVHDFAGFLTQVVYHYGEPGQFLPPLTPEEKIRSLIQIDGVTERLKRLPDADKIQ